MRFETIWTEQCRATKRIKRSFGAKSALDRPEFAKELPRFLAAIWKVFNEYEIAGHLAAEDPRQGREKRGDDLTTTHHPVSHSMSPSGRGRSITTPSRIRTSETSMARARICFSRKMSA
jgi:hypothetical protein